MKRNGTQLLFLLLTTALVRFVYLWIVPESAVSIDMQRWLRVAEFLRAGKNPYIESSYLNAAPFWMQILFVLDGISRALGLPILHLIQALLIIVDLAIVSVLYAALSERGKAAGKILLFGYALNPASIVLSIQHGQFDILVGLFILLFVLAVARYMERAEPIEWLYATFWLGLGVWAKTVPFVLLPLVTLKLQDLRPRWLILGALQLVLPVTIALSVIYVLSPSDVTSKVLNYVSVPGYFGVSGILGIFLDAEQFVAATKLASQIFFALLLGVMVLVTAIIRERGELSYPKLLLVATLLIMLLPALGPGYGPQYLSWFLPLVLLLLAEQVTPIIHRLLSSFLVLAAVTYSFEYLLLSTHGAMLLSYFPELAASTSELKLPESQTLFRLPLFFSYLSIQMIGWRKWLQQN